MSSLPNPSISPRIGSNSPSASLIRSCLFSVVLILVATSNVHATEALIFSGGGYAIQILVGSEDDPVVAQVLFMPPGGKDFVVLPREGLQVEKFDMEKKILTMRFSNKNEPNLPTSFSLSVKKAKAVLSIDGKEIKGDEEFNWDI